MSVCFARTYEGLKRTCAEKAPTSFNVLPVPMRD